MPRLLSFLTRAVALLAVFGMAAGVAAAAPADPVSEGSADAVEYVSRTELAYALLGGEADSCNMSSEDESEGMMVDCGASLLGDFADGALLLQLTRESCSVLLEELLGEPETCRPDDIECQRFMPGAPAPASPKLASNGSSTMALVDRLRTGACAAAITGIRPQSQRRPGSLDLEPPVPPPRPSL